MSVLWKTGCMALNHVELAQDHNSIEILDSVARVRKICLKKRDVHNVIPLVSKETEPHLQQIYIK
jgi:hypothetical protein